MDFYVYYELGKIYLEQLKRDIWNMRFYNKRVFVQITDAGIRANALHKKAYMKDLFNKEYFYYVFMQDMNFEVQWEDFEKKLNEWVKLRESDKNGK